MSSEPLIEEEGSYAGGAETDVVEPQDAAPELEESGEEEESRAFSQAEVLTVLRGLGRVCCCSWFIILFFFLSTEVYKATRINRDPAFVNDNSHAFEANYALQLFVGPFWSRMAHRAGLRRFVAVTASMLSAFLPPFVLVLMYHNDRSIDSQIEGYYWAGAVTGLCGIPVAVGFAIARQNVGGGGTGPCCAAGG